MRYVAAFLLTLGLCACSRSEYVQVMDLPLTAPGEGRTEVLATLPIGTKCEVVKALSEGWVHVRFGDLEGEVSKESLGREKPDPDRFLQQAETDVKLSPHERLQYAIRAATLAPEHPKALAATPSAPTSTVTWTVRSSRATLLPVRQREGEGRARALRHLPRGRASHWQHRRVQARGRPALQDAGHA